jgi:plasmid replication initiation protein
MKGEKKLHLRTFGKSSPTEERLKKSVGAIHSSGKLTLVQRKLANILLYSAYDNLLSTRTHTIPLPIMCSMLGWEASNRIEHLKDALVALQQTTLQFNLRDDGGESWESMAMLSYAKIKNGVCTYRYDEALAERLFDPAMFAMISLRVQRRIDSAHALNLYENCLRYKDTNTGSTGRWDLDFFREMVGAIASYCDDFRQLNAKVIKPAINKINEVSDIVVSVEYERQMRSVVALKFHVREKTEAEKQAMPSALPGISFPESVDEYQELRNTTAFKALRKHGITERLAFAWISERGERAILDLVAYTEERDVNKQIKTNTRAYMQSLVKAGAEFCASEYDKQKEMIAEVKVIEEQTEAKKRYLAELESAFRSNRITEARNALTLNERNTYARAWLQTEAGKGKETSYDEAKGRFKEAVTNIQFEKVYLTKVLTKPYTQAEFIQWLKKENKIDPTQF